MLSRSALLTGCLRELLALTGAKKGDHGQCGACTCTSTAAACCRA
jgi:aerobic-type carbon monoxide dehydrogenase small subunit (CoxS/CutS family)